MTSLTNSAEWQLAALANVREGLRRRQKELPSKYFYDLRGSQLFEQITQVHHADHIVQVTVLGHRCS